MLMIRLARFGATQGKGNGLPLLEVLRVLSENGIDSLMVEGGARVLRCFLSGGLAQQAVVTVSPVEMNGLRIFDKRGDACLRGGKPVVNTARTW